MLEANITIRRNHVSGTTSVFAMSPTARALIVNEDSLGQLIASASVVGGVVK